MDQLKCSTCKGVSEKGACPYCRKRLKKLLTELVSFIDLLRSNPQLRQQVTSQQEGRGSMSMALIINVQIVDLIAKTGVQSVLQSWSDLIIESRELSPSIANSSKERSKLHAVHYVLDTHNDWLADSEYWRDYYNEIKEPWTTLRRIIYGERKPPKAVPCPVSECGGKLRLEANADVHCTLEDSHAWKYHEWSRLALLLVDPNVQS